MTSAINVTNSQFIQIPIGDLMHIKASHFWSGIVDFCLMKYPQLLRKSAKLSHGYQQNTICLHIQSAKNIYEFQTCSLYGVWGYHTSSLNIRSVSTIGVVSWLDHTVMHRISVSALFIDVQWKHIGWLCKSFIFVKISPCIYLFQFTKMVIQAFLSYGTYGYHTNSLVSLGAVKFTPMGP